MSGTNDRARALRPAIGPALLKSALPIGAAVAAALISRFFIYPGLDDYNAGLMLNIGINIILAVSLTMVNGFTGQFSMGHAGFMAAGGYAAGAVSYYTTLAIWGDALTHGSKLSERSIQISADFVLPWFGAGDLVFVGSILMGGLVAAALGFLVGLPSLRLKGDYLAIVTLGFGEIVRVMIQQTKPVIKPDAFAGAKWTEIPLALGGSLGFAAIPKYTSPFWVYLAVGLTLIAAYRIKIGTFGRAFLSIREDEVAAEAMGVNTTKYKVRAFVMAAFFAGIAGGLYAHFKTVGPIDAGFQRSFDIIIMVVLGGLGSISGALIAAVIVTLLPEWLRAVNEYRMIIYALALILMMIFRPQGLLGVREIWDLGPVRKLGAVFKRGKAVAK